jgi:hypothetical protein
MPTTSPFRWGAVVLDGLPVAAVLVRLRVRRERELAAALPVNGFKLEETADAVGEPDRCGGEAAEAGRPLHKDAGGGGRRPRHAGTRSFVLNCPPCVCEEFLVLPSAQSCTLAVELPTYCCVGVKRSVQTTEASTLVHARDRSCKYTRSALVHAVAATSGAVCPGNAVCGALDALQGVLAGSCTACPP